jgi:hypothetical protein
MLLRPLSSRAQELCQQVDAVPREELKIMMHGDCVDSLLYTLAS